MKNNLVKSVAVFATASALLLSSVTCFAATAATTTTYANEKTSVVSTVSGVASGTMVTYLASSGENGAVTSSSDIVYIDQQTSDGATPLTFSYTLKNADTRATIKYGSDVSATATDLNEADTQKNVAIEGVTPDYDATKGSITFSAEKVAIGGEVTATVAPKAGYEIDTVTINGSAVAVSGQSYTVPYKEGGATIAVTFKATVAPVEATAALKIEGICTVDGVEVPTIGLVGKLAGDVTGLKYGIYIEKDDVPFELSAADEITNGFYEAAQVDEADAGYYAVQLAAVEFPAGSYVIKPYIGTQTYGDGITITK